MQNALFDLEPTPPAPPVHLWSPADCIEHKRQGTPCRLCANHGAVEAAQIGGVEAINHADAEWVFRATTRMDELIDLGVGFTADDIIAEVGLPSEGSSNAIGGIFQAYAKRRRIQRIGYAKSTRREAHARVVAIWRGVQA